MERSGRLVGVALAGLVGGYVLGTQDRPVAVAEPATGVSTGTYVTSGPEARYIVVWKLDDGKPIRAERYWCAGDAIDVSASGVVNPDVK